MDPDLQRAQHGVISRQQLIDAHPETDPAEFDKEITRRVRRREWARIHPGVFVDHTGPPTWMQRAWAAVLFYAPAALSDRSCLHVSGVRGYEPRPGEPIHVCVDRTRGVRRRPGIDVRQIVRAESLCAMNLGPPRQRLEHAFLDVASRERRLDGTVAVLSDAVQDRRTTPTRLLSALDERPRLRHRAIMAEVLGEVRHGVRSVLEHRYLLHVERAHGLPLASRQRRVRLATVGATDRDVEYRDHGVVIELNGRIGHDRAADGWDDLDRYVAAAVAGELTVPVGWRQVLEACRLATAVAAILRARGWAGTIRSCGAGCTAAPIASVVA